MAHGARCMAHGVLPLARPESRTLRTRTPVFTLHTHATLHTCNPHANQLITHATLTPTHATPAPPCRWCPCSSGATRCTCLGSSTSTRRRTTWHATSTTGAPHCAMCRPEPLHAGRTLLHHASVTLVRLQQVVTSGGDGVGVSGACVMHKVAVQGDGSGAWGAMGADPTAAPPPSVHLRFQRFQRPWFQSWFRSWFRSWFLRAHASMRGDTSCPVRELGMPWLVSGVQHLLFLCVYLKHWCFCACSCASCIEGGGKEEMLGKRGATVAVWLPMKENTTP